MSRRSIGLCLCAGAGSLFLIAGSCGHPDVGPGAATTTGPGSPGATTVGSGGGSSTTTGSGGTGGGVGQTREAGAGAGIVDASVDAPVVKASCGDSPYSDPYTPGYRQDPAVLARVQSTLATMTLKEKADQIRGTDSGANANFTDIFETPDNVARNIRGFKFRDGPRGANLLAPFPDRNPGLYSTAFPVPMARGAAFDMDLELRIGIAIGDETTASSNTMLLAPTVNILRHPAWGRAQETYGEDPYLLGRLGSAFVAGLQQFVPACAKHYAANNIENGRAADNAQMDEQTLREIYARHYEMIIKDGGVACVMAAYNLINGVKSTQNKHLLTDILRDDFGFKGLLLSDWWAMPPGTAVANDDAKKANAAQAILAGLDLEVPWAYNFLQLESITDVTVPLAAINQAAGRILEQKYRFKIDTIPASGQLGGLKAPTTTLSAARSIENNGAHVQLAQEAALKSMVLLKNDNTTLPIRRSAVTTLAVIGAVRPSTLTNVDPGTALNGSVNFAVDVRVGDLGSSRVRPDPAKSSGPLAGIREIAGTGINVVTGATAASAQNADFVVVVAGLTPQDEGEEYTGAGDRANFSLDGKTGSAAQNTLITQVAALGKPMVVVLEGGSVIDMPWLAQVPAVVMAWYPGMDGGRALGKLLFGDANFGGKLPITWPKQWADEPVFNSGPTTTMDYYLGYRWFDNRNVAPLFAFGYGLSYTTYAYSNLQVPCSDVTKNGVVDVKVDVTNTGTVAGDEVAFLFVSYPGSQNRHPAKELKGFFRASIDPGQTKRFTIPLRISDLKYWNTAANAWAIETGTVQIMVGPSSDKLMLKDTMILK